MVKYRARIRKNILISKLLRSRSKRKENRMDIISKAKKLLLYRRKARTDNVVGNLHKITAGVLLALSVFVSSGIYIKKPISCVGDKTIAHAVDAYCWIHSTFTVPNKTNEQLNEIIYPHPGIGPELAEDEIRVHKYYQWVCFVLFFQAIAFYLPRLYWKRSEQGRIHAISKVGFEEFKREENSIVKKRTECVDYFVKAIGTHESWAFHYFICELLNFVNCVIQIDLTDRFVGRALSQYGFTLLQFSSQNPLLRTDPMALAFPTVTRCSFRTFGPTGNIIKFDNLCVLPLNIYNEKFYPLIWLWFIMLAVISGLAVMYRIALYLLPELRHELLKRRFTTANNEIRNLYKVNLKLGYSDWFLLYQVGKNMRPSAFCDFLEDLTSRFSNELPYTNSNNSSTKQKFQ